MLFLNGVCGPLLSLLLLLSPVFAQIKKDQVGVAYNKDFLAKTGKVVLGSIVTIEGLAECSDSQVAELAFQAADAAQSAFMGNFDMIAADYTRKHKHKRPPDRLTLWPAVTTTLVVDNTAYISTSIKGSGAYLYDPPRYDVPADKPRYVTLRGNNQNSCRKEVVDALRRRQLKSPSKFKEMKQEEKRKAKADARKDAKKNNKPFDGKDWDRKHGKPEPEIEASGYRTGASCGEPMAALAYCTTGTEKKLAEANARVMAVNRPLFEEGIFVKPCGGWGLKGKPYKGEWGCKVLLNTEDGLNIKVISEKNANEREKKQGKIATNAKKIEYP
ncbi:hypothetical protein Q7P37_000324 [Cladosporium fusiforme]